MTTEPFLQAEPVLADLAEQFEQWRRTRATAQERIPPPLWDQAVVLTTVLLSVTLALCHEVFSSPCQPPPGRWLFYRSGP